MRYSVILICALLAACAGPPDATAVAKPPPTEAPNFVLIFADDLGYGDLGAYGSTRNRTPHLDRMAAEGQKMTDFYAFPSCSPSRAALLTGCYPTRVGMPVVVGPPGPAWTAERQFGLHPDETTLAELFGKAGYATGMVGKWHLGHFAETMPTRQGFDEFFGLPYSNDMLPENGYGDLNLYDGEAIVEVNPDQTDLTERYTERAVDYIERNHKRPFFLYLAHSMPHVPLYALPESRELTDDDLYAAVIHEVDRSVGKVLATLREHGIDDNTLVIFTSDNGPWLSYGDHAGSAGPLREGKGTTWEGGMRVPMIARWPGHIEAGQVSHAVAGLPDILPTAVEQFGLPTPPGKIDGRPLNLAALPNSAPAAAPFYFFLSDQVEAVRQGRWKLHLPHTYRTISEPGNGGERGTYDYTARTELALYDVTADPGERYDRSADHPSIVADLREKARGKQAEIDAEKRPPFRLTK